MDECEDKMCEHPPGNWSSQGVSLFSEAVDVFILLGLFVVFCLFVFWHSEYKPKV